MWFIYDPSNLLRFSLEIIFALYICYEIYREIRLTIALTLKHRQLFAYFQKDYWNIIDSAVLTGLFAQYIQWFYLYGAFASVFAPPLKYNVYRSLESVANRLQVATEHPDGANGTGTFGYEALAELKQTYAMAGELYGMVTDLQYLQMVIVILQLIRLLRTLAFHPKLALVTETVREAGMDLIHFLILFALVFFAPSQAMLFAASTSSSPSLFHDDMLSTLCRRVGINDEMVDTDMAAVWTIYFSRISSSFSSSF